MTKKNQKKLVEVAKTYLRAAVAAVMALYLAGETNPKNLGIAAISAVAGPLLKALDPKSTQFGIGSK
jgi:hypothetical protein